MVKRAPHHNQVKNIGNSTSVSRMAGEALRNLRGLSAEEQSEAGAFVLGQARQYGDERPVTWLTRALQVMEKFPHFPRPPGRRHHESPGESGERIASFEDLTSGS